jgi:succinate dehydrogenase/fumarate reductase flavoprotein subunit
MSERNRSKSAASPSQSTQEDEMTGEKQAPSTLSRRDFVKGAAIGAGALAGVGALASCAPAATPAPTSAPPEPAAPAPTCPPAEQCPPCETPWLPQAWDYEADVVICGYGSTGMPAAIEAYDAGATDVLVIEKADWLGGMGHRCGGGIVSAESIVQKELGVVSSKGDLYEYLVACGEGMVDPDLIRSWANNDNVDWIIQDLGGQPLSEWSKTPLVPDTTPDEDILPIKGYGLDYGPAVYFSKYGFKPVEYCHWFTPDPEAADFNEQHPPATSHRGGTSVFKTLNAAINARTSIRTMTSTSLVGLVATPDREVLGITAVGPDGKTLYMKAKRGVVIGTGGWSRNQAMVMNYLLIPPSEFEPGINPSSLATPEEEDGTGLVAAQAIGADTTDMAVGGYGGLKINAQAQVIDIYGNPIPRLYSGGRTTGGVMFRQYPIHGCAFSSAIWFGRVAGKNIAALEPWA